MNRDELEKMWEQSRDGELDPSCQEVFDDHMISDRKAAGLWGAESRWLESLKSWLPTAEKPGESSFTDKVLEHWKRQPHRGVLARFPRIPQVQWRSALFAGGWTAAAAAVAMIMMLTQPQQQKQMLDAQVVRQSTPIQMQVDPLSILVHDVTEQYQQRPAEVFNLVRDSRAMFSMDQALRLVTAQPEPQPQPRRLSPRPGETGTILRAVGRTRPNRRR
jgi:hypothetical protein